MSSFVLLRLNIDLESLSEGVEVGSVALGRESDSSDLQRRVHVGFCGYEGASLSFSHSLS